MTKGLGAASRGPSVFQRRTRVRRCATQRCASDWRYAGV